MLAELRTAIQFLTRIPLPGESATAGLARSAAWFPVAGLLVGGIVGLAFAATALVLPASLAGWVAVAVEMLITGALHPDGLADTADGLAGQTPERRLAIMKDPRLGSYGGVALVLTLAGRLLLLSALPSQQVPAALAVAHTVSRWGPVWGLARYPYAREGGGTGAAFARAGRRELALASGIALAAGWAAGGLWGLVAVLAGAGAAGLVAAYLARRLGGLTGDTYGALAEVGLLTALAVLVATSV